VSDPCGRWVSRGCDPGVIAAFAGSAAGASVTCGAGSPWAAGVQGPRRLPRLPAGANRRRAGAAVRQRRAATLWRPVNKDSPSERAGSGRLVQIEMPCEVRPGEEFPHTVRVSDQHPTGRNGADSGTSCDDTAGQHNRLVHDRTWCMSPVTSPSTCRPTTRPHSALIAVPPRVVAFARHGRDMGANVGMSVFDDDGRWAR
jgi:hypothetical protein